MEEVASENSSQLAVKRAPMPELDPQALFRIEREASHLAEEFVRLNKQLQASLNNISAASVCSLQTYEETVERSCSRVEECLDEEKVFLIKAKELSRNMEPIYKLQERINSVKTVIATLDSQI